MHLYLTRHGETEWNSLRKTQGRTDTNLTVLGLQQAEKLAERLKTAKITAIYSSPLKRAWQTAEIISKVLSIDIQTAEELGEMSLGSWEGLTFNEIQSKYPDIYDKWQRDPHLCKIPNGDSFYDVAERTESFIKRIRSQYNEDDRILFVSHALTVKIIITTYLEMNPVFIHRIRQDNTSLNIIDFYDKRIMLSLLNDTCHLGGK